MSGHFDIRGSALLLFAVIGQPNTSTDQHEGNGVLDFPNIFSQKSRAKEASKDGLGKFDDKQFRQLTVFDDSIPQAIADDGCKADVGHDPKRRRKGKPNAAVQGKANAQQDESAK